MSPEVAREIIAPFYDALNRPAETRAGTSFSAEGVSKGREEFIQQVKGFGKLIPDLAWAIQEVLVAGDRIVVRSEAGGTPAGELFGVPHGGKSFRIMTIDVHTVRDGKLAVAHHVEDWAGAVRQLSAK
jgi:predicted ester cyclase